MPGTGGKGAVTRSTLRQQIADALRDEVLAGRLQPGQEFTVKEIAEQYGVSATPVREALVDLSAQGLLDAVQHRGFQVHAYSPDDYRGMVEARSLVSDGIFQRLGDAGLPGGQEARAMAALAGVRRRGEEAQRAADAGDLAILIGYDLRFWRELSALFGNPYLVDFLHRLRVQCWVCAVQHLRRGPGGTGGAGGTDGGWAAEAKGRLWSGHTELVDALVRRDAVAAQAVVRAYNAHSLALIERLAAG
ncbi:GntR family transcriptional regulator [Streptomyces sp. NPDC008313]|uniref:GntR family transcriptional regulator n=1 Tax=Streptomyces sp. NPDC008313 TaxID=3364826 RepID=UPI0036E9A2E5